MIEYNLTKHLKNKVSLHVAQAFAESGLLARAAKKLEQRLAPEMSASDHSATNWGLVAGNVVLVPQAWQEGVAILVYPQPIIYSHNLPLEGSLGALLDMTGTLSCDSSLLREVSEQNDQVWRELADRVELRDHYLIDSLDLSDLRVLSNCRTIVHKDDVPKVLAALTNEGYEVAGLTGDDHLKQVAMALTMLTGAVNPTIDGLALAAETLDRAADRLRHDEGVVTARAKIGGGV